MTETPLSRTPIRATENRPSLIVVGERVTSRLPEQRKEPEVKGQPFIRIAQSCAPEARDAARAFHAAVEQPDMALVIFFCSSEYDLEVLAEEMKRLFAGVQVVGCTTAGEIGPAWL